MLADRLQAKMSRDFPTADRIRDDLRGMGVEVYVRSASPAFFPLSQKPAACFLPAPASCFSLRANTRRRTKSGLGAPAAAAAAAAAAAVGTEVVAVATVAAAVMVAIGTHNLLPICHSP